MALTLLVAPCASAASLTRGPYLQLLTTNSATVVWNTDTPAACSLTIHEVGAAPQAVAGSTDTVCALPLDGLAPGTLYGYTPLADGAALTSESVFRTDDPSSPFAFLAVGDSGSGDANQMALASTMGAQNPDFIVHTGDMIYENATAADFNPKFFVPYADLIRRIMFWPCLGNHDVRTANGQPWRDAFYTPANNATHDENYYSFDYGNAHFVILDSNGDTSPGTDQWNFADQDLAASSALWKFVAFHHTIYSNGDHGSNRGIQKDLVPIFDRRGVDVVLMGHDHDYERTLPLLAGTVVPSGRGTVYVTTGGGGRSLSGVGTSFFTGFSEVSFNFARIAIDGPTLQETELHVDGTTKDSFSITKKPCGTDADCEDSNSCTVDYCSAFHTCQNDPASFDNIETQIEAGLLVGICSGETVPHVVQRLLTQANGLIQRGAKKKKPRQAKPLIVRAVQLLKQGDRIARRAGNKGRVSAGCAAQLDATIAEARTRARCLATSLH